MDKILKVTVLYGTQEFDLGECNADHISLIILVHAMTKEVTGRGELLNGGFTIRVELPWSKDTIVVTTDSELLDMFKEFRFRGYDEIRFQIEKTAHSPIDEPKVVEQLGWCNEEAAMFDFTADSESEDIESDEGDGVQSEERGESDGDRGNNGVGVGVDVNQGVFAEVNSCLYGNRGNNGLGVGVDLNQGMFAEVNVGLDGNWGNNGVGVGVDVNQGMFDEVNVGLDGFAGEGVNDGEGIGLNGVEDGGFAGEGVGLDGVEDDGVQTGKGVQNEVGIDGDHIDGDDEITKQCMALSNGQTFGSNEEMRNIFKEYAIREGVTLGRIKNDLLRQTYVCKSDGYPWRAHGSRTIYKKSLIIKTLDDKHDCHRVYNNNEVKVKWIASRVESLVKSNHTVSAKLLGDLLLERYNVAVDMNKLYNVKHRLMSQLMSEYNSSFRYLRQYSYTLNQTNPGTAIHIKIQKPHSTFYRLFLSFQAQKQGFLEGCRPFIGLDGCHLKGPCGGVLLSTVALDANSEIFPLTVCICEKETKLS
ncbi:hypothetical protein Dsin_015998 [Dipteronia sinensis]|uniref:Transposase MuDR plant domain-containing protein n=1 Tax=Dipteronia sinensis TaxID=43782 RepID=A0AAE0ADI3_9ROSI|nr:hypothetical protein Dsin_015998 [Dipteronia sinensis]